VICLTIEPDKLDSVIRCDGLDFSFIEVRLDYDPPSIFELRDILSSIRDRLILTIRRVGEGGFYDGSENDRYNCYVEAISIRPRFIDIEFYSDIFSEVAFVARRNGVGVIASYHDFHGTPSLEELLGIYERMGSSEYVDIVKIVTYADDYLDNLKIFNLLGIAGGGKPLISFCMGSKGRVSRLSAPLFGSYLTYVSLDDELAPGQFRIDEFRDLWGCIYDG
jgi:3-dehydroquinate dehydratase-1